MNRLWAIALALILLAPSVRAQQDADERYVTIYNIIQQGDSLADGGQPQDALATYIDAKSKLTSFQKLFPNWDQGIVSYRMSDLDKKIATLQSQLTTKQVPAPAAPGAPVLSQEEQQAQAQASELQAELQTAKLENQELQGKLKEALATQPAAVDATELAAAQQQLRDLMKQNELLKAGQGQGQTQTVVVAVEDTNAVSKLNEQLAESTRKYSAEHDRAQELMQENKALQRNLASAAPDSSAVAILQSENDRLKTQLQTLQIAAENASAAGELARKLNDAKTQIANLQAASALASLEKAALENKVRKLSTQLAESAANFDSRLKDLSDQRDELLKKLDSANAKNSTRKVSDAAAQIAELNKEVESLRARVEVDESKPVPYADDELALFRQSQPGVAPLEHSIKELPAGTAELVASAQRHFSNHEFTDAEADYQKILDRDQNNGLALANLATIELQEGKLDDAAKHIQAAVDQSPNDAYNLTTLGFLKFRQGKYDDAMDVLSRAAKIDPNNPEIQNYLGVTLSHKGLRVQAESALRKAILIDANYAPAHNNLAVIYLSQNPPLPQLARWHYQKALDGGQPRNPDLEKMLADKGAPVAAAESVPAP
ncbi:MAG TPA: tetratricopeptide repeat protein [Candidatus Sulfotelmatobacter sp.]|jgi:Tfp pilus assembly protein PilF|nr:tetratricopeptide repeat protein [Candidatus Sulfotelmatobacter sp.]